MGDLTNTFEDGGDRTMSVALCAEHPPRMSWPNRNLILGFCPACGWHEGSDGRASARVLRARELSEARE